MAPQSNYSIVAVDKFVQATRDSGYKGTASAVAELVDNSIQAGATRIAIAVQLSKESAEHPIVLRVVDNGCGMNSKTLRTALRFGGSSRFNDRAGLGRYGMGLPNSSLSQARRLTAYTWTRERGQVLSSYLDLDEIAEGDLTEVPRPARVPRPSFATGSASGTAIEWTRCDRLDNRRISTIVRKLHAAVGRRFRHFLWAGVEVSINDELVCPIDPLFLHPESLFQGATQFADDATYEIAAAPDTPDVTGSVRVRFSELPVAEWSHLNNREKRARGISKGAGVSVVRCGREVDYGWFFLGGKRRENYDDWWRCEISFDPVLDEAFGITHTKQQVRPRRHVLEALGPDLEATARALNKRARQSHTDAKSAVRFGVAESRAAQMDRVLPRLSNESRPRDRSVLRKLKGKLPRSSNGSSNQSTSYQIVRTSLNSTSFFEYARDKEKLILVLNPDHPFYKLVYEPLLASDNAREETLRSQIDLILLAAARAEALMEGEESARDAERLRAAWSDTLATFLTG